MFHRRMKALSLHACPGSFILPQHYPARYLLERHVIRQRTALTGAQSSDVAERLAGVRFRLPVFQRPLAHHLLVSSPLVLRPVCPVAGDLGQLAALQLLGDEGLPRLVVALPLTSLQSGSALFRIHAGRMQQILTRVEPQEAQNHWG